MTRNTDKRNLERDKAKRKALANRDKARRKLLQQREELARRRRKNRDTSAANREDGQEDQTNPTAHSTMPGQKTNAENAARNSNSTVPPRPKHSTTPAKERLYGLKLRDAVEGNDADSSDDDGSDGSNGGDRS
ncbi:MAG: hypothetical protein ACI9YT_001012 [Halobacteriales archaeon]|jgi:hypothetical protein